MLNKREISGFAGFVEETDSRSALPHRTELHLTRKIWHLCMGLILLSAYQWLSMNRWTASLAVGSLFLFSCWVEVSRLRNPLFNRFVSQFFSPVMRSCELKRVSGIAPYLGGVLVSVLVFPAPVAVTSILCLAISDPLASLFGILWGDRSIRFSNGKSAIGTLAGIVASSLVVLLVFSGMGLNPWALFAIVALGGIAGGTAELLPLGMDDNFSIPVVTGFVVWLGYLLAQTA